MKKSSAKQKLNEAFFTLIENNHYSEISVTDLIAEAGCSRTTFYRYYDDIIDMYGKVCEELINEFLKEISAAFWATKFDRIALFDIFCEKLISQEKYIRLLCGRNGSRRFFDILLDKSALLVNGAGLVFGKKEKFILRFIVFSGIATYVKSIMDNEPFDKNYLLIYRDTLEMVKQEGDFYE